MTVCRHTKRLNLEDPVKVIRRGFERDLPKEPKPGDVFYATDTRTLWISDAPCRWTGVELGPSVILI